MNETLVKINELLKSLNSSFEFSAEDIKNDGDDDISNKVIIKSLKDDGSEFIECFFNMFSEIIKSLSDEYELVIHKEKGIVIAKKVTNYVFLDDKNAE